FTSTPSPPSFRPVQLRSRWTINPQRSPLGFSQHENPPERSAPAGISFYRMPMKALIVSVDLGNPDYQAHADEFVMLAEGAGAQVVGTVVARRARPDAAYFIGKGKLEEAQLLAEDGQAEVVLFDQALSPAQQRNLERSINLRVVDRVALILDIFALRAKSHEGKLQVELAQLQHLSTRLTRLWTHL